MTDVSSAVLAVFVTVFFCAIVIYLIYLWCQNHFR